MNNCNEAYWFAVQAKPHYEQRAAARLRTVVAEVFLPMIKSFRLVCGNRRSVLSPLFPAYFFARFSPDASLTAVQNAHGVIRVLGNRNAPVPLESEMVRCIQDLVAEDGFIQHKEEGFLPGDRVSITNGPLTGWLGKVEREADDGRRTLILLDAIEQARLLVDRSWLETTDA